MNKLVEFAKQKLPLCIPYKGFAYIHLFSFMCAIALFRANDTVLSRAFSAIYTINDKGDVLPHVKVLAALCFCLVIISYAVSCYLFAFAASSTIVRIAANHLADVQDMISGKRGNTETVDVWVMQKDLAKECEKWNGGATGDVYQLQPLDNEWLLMPFTRHMFNKLDDTHKRVAVGTVKNEKEINTTTARIYFVKDGKIALPPI